MSNCDNELNSQVKALHARLDRVDEDLRAHAAAQVLQAISFLANPLTVAQGAVMAAQFASKKAFNALAKQLPGYEEYKKLQHLESASLVEGLTETLAGIADGMVELAVNELEKEITAQVKAFRDYTAAVISQEINAVLQPLLEAYNTATALANVASAALSAIKKFLDTLSNVSACKIDTSIIRLENTPASISSNITPAD